MAENSERMRWVDIARGIGILCVVFGGHWITEDAFGPRAYACCNLIYAFIMPLFFVLSGMMCRRAFSAQTVASKADSLLVPYLLYTPILVVCLGLSESFSTGQWIAAIRAFLLFDGVYVTWFFPCLFATELVGIFLISRIHRLWGLMACAVISAVVGLVLNMDGVRQYVPQIFKCRTVPLALVFWLSGFLAQRAGVFEMRRKKLATLAVVVVCAAGLGLRINYRCNFTHAIVGNPFVFYFSAFSGVVLVLLLSLRIGKGAFLEWCGRNSLLILVAHAIVPTLTCAWGGGILSDTIVTALLCLGLSHAGPLFSGRARLFRKFVSSDKEPKRA